jgi:hypothetical protein
MKSKPSDHAIAILKAVLNVMPYAGGPLASLVGDYVPTSKQRAMELGFELLTDKVADIDSRIDEKEIDKEAFADLYVKFEDVAAKTNREDKLRAAANILANSLLPQSDPARSPYEELEHFMHCADALSSGAIAVLGASIQIKQAQHAGHGDTSFSFSELRRKLPGLDPHLILGLAAELRGWNLLYGTEGLIQTPEFDAYQLRVTPLGSRFAERFIEGRM